MTSPRRRRTAREIANRGNRRAAQNRRVVIMIVIAVAGLVGVLFFRQGCGQRMAKLMSALDPPRQEQGAEDAKEDSPPRGGPETGEQE